MKQEAGRMKTELTNKENGKFTSNISFFIFRKDGFTLLEVLIALAIVGGLLVTLIYTLSYQLSLVDRQEVITVATFLAKSKIADLEKSPENKKGNFETPYDGYSYETSVKDSPYAGISEIMVLVKGGKEEVRLNEFVFK
jgi:general secretion pathway protein I